MDTPEFVWLQHYPDTPKWDMEIPLRSMADVFDETVEKYAARPGMDFMGKIFTWGQLGHMARGLAVGLQDLGVKKGSKVGLFLPNGPYFLAAYYAVLKAGGTAVNYNPLYAERELAHQIEDSETDIMITLDLALLYDKAYGMLRDTRLKKIVVARFTDILPFPKNVLFPLLKARDCAKIATDERILWWNDIADANKKPNTPAFDLKEDVAVLQYTGGTTGVPKGAMLTHANIYANAVQCYANFPQVQEQERMLAILPFFHVFAMTVTMNMAVLSGMEILTIPRFDLNESLKLIQRRRPHYMAGVPAIFNGINNCPHLKKYDLSSLEFCISGGAPLPVEVKKKFEEKTGCTVVEGYGLTESSPVSNVNPPFGENIAGSIGLPVPQTIIEIIDREDKVTPVPLGERGEVCITGPQVMKGYWNKPDETADVLRPGPYGLRLHTGDIGIMDEKGYTYIVDRIKDMIITNGYNVYPRNIEEAIYQHPNIEECIVAGLPDTQRGEIVKAWIKLKDERELTEGDLRAFLEDKLSKMEMPRKIEFRDAPLPKTMIGKLSRKDIVAEELDKKA